MKIYFVRHGQTDFNIEKRIQGGMDTPLNETGIEQAISLGKKCLDASLKFDAIYSSPKQRAGKTAEIISQSLNTDYIILNGIEEINLGDWQGLTWREVKDNYSESFNIWFNNRRYTRAPGGESYEDMLKRVFNALNMIMDKDYDKVLVVTHSAVLMCILSLIYETPFEEMKKHKPDNGEIIEIDSKLLKDIQIL